MWPSQTVNGRSKAAETIALGAGSKNDGISSSRDAASQMTTRPANVNAGANRSSSAARRRRDGVAVSGGGAGEKLSTDMVRYCVKGGLGQRLHRARPRQRHLDD